MDYDAIDVRCPECGAPVWGPDVPIEHRAWCAVLRRLEPTERELPPGPIWTNGAAEDEPDHPCTPDELRAAAERITTVRAEQGRAANAWLIGYVASGAGSDPTWPTRSQRAILAALDLETLEMPR